MAITKSVEGLVLEDGFDRANGAVVGNSWIERTPNWTIQDNSLRILQNATEWVEHAAESTDGAFLQSLSEVGVSGTTSSLVLGRFNWGAGSPSAYGLRWEWNAGTIGILRISSGSGSVLSSTVKALVANGTNYAGQLYIGESVQEGWVDGTTVSASDATHDALSGGVAFRHIGLGEFKSRHFWWCRSKFIVVTGLGSGSGQKVKVRNSGGSVIAQATESGGTATIDCSRFGGATEVIPSGGWTDLIITDSSDVTLDTYNAAGVYPGTSYSWDGGGPATVPDTPTITVTDQTKTTADLASSVYSGSGSHTNSQWQIAADGTSFDAETGFASTVFDSGSDAVNLESYDDAGPLSAATAYEATVRHENATGWSDWATPDEFTTDTNTAPTTPGAFTAYPSTALDATPFLVQHGASTDADSDPITYTWEYRFDGGDWTALTSGITDAELSFDPTGRAEGTWELRVKATDGEDDSDWRTGDEFTIDHPFADPNLRVNPIGQTTGTAEIDSVDETWVEVQFDTTLSADTGYASIVTTQTSTAAGRFVFSMSGLTANTAYRTRVRYKVGSTWSPFFEETWSTLAVGEELPEAPSVDSDAFFFTAPKFGQPVFGTAVPVSWITAGGLTTVALRIRLGFSGAWTLLEENPTSPTTFDSTAFSDSAMGGLYTLQFEFSDGTFAEHPGFRIDNARTTDYYADEWEDLDGFGSLGDEGVTWAAGDGLGNPGRIRTTSFNTQQYAWLVREGIYTDEGQVTCSGRIHTNFKNVAWGMYDAELAWMGCGLSLSDDTSAYGVYARIGTGFIPSARYPTYNCQTAGISAGGGFDVIVRKDSSATAAVFSEPLPIAASFINFPMGPLRCTRLADYHIFLRVTKPDRINFPNRIDILARCFGPTGSVLIEETVDLDAPLQCGFPGFTDAKVRTPLNAGYRSYTTLGFNSTAAGIAACEDPPELPPPTEVPAPVTGLPCVELYEHFAPDNTTVEWAAATAANVGETYIGIGYLRTPEDYAEQEVNFPSGGVTIGSARVEIIDPPIAGGTQDNGLLTSRLPTSLAKSAVMGRRGRLRRFTDEGWVTLADGPCGPPKLHTSYSSYEWDVRDTRERERKLRAFHRTGTTSMLPRGIAIPWGLSNPRWLTGTVQLSSTVQDANGTLLEVPLSHLWTGLDTLNSTDALVSTSTREAMAPRVESSEQVGEVSPGGTPVTRYDLIWDNVEIWWLPAGDASTQSLSDDWNKIRRPRVQGFFTGDLSNVETIGGVVHEDVTVTGFSGLWGVRNVLLGDPSIGEAFNTFPSPGQAIDLIVVYAGPATEALPYHWGSTASASGGSYFAGEMGDFLTDCYEGAVTDPDPVTYDPVPTGIRYDSATMATLTDEVLVRVTKPTDDLRDWLEKNVYAATGYAPTVDFDGRIAPRSEVRPTDTGQFVEINEDNAIPSPGWEHGEVIVNSLDYTYRRYGVATSALQSITDSASSLSWLQQTVKDLVGRTVASGDAVPREPVDRVLVREITNIWKDATPAGQSSIDVFGEQLVEVDSEAVGTIGTQGQVLPTQSGDYQRTVADEIGYQYQVRRWEALRERYNFGPQMETIEIFRNTAALRALQAGDWVRFNIPWVPNYTTGTRGVNHYAQIVAINDLDCATRRITVEIVEPVPGTTGASKVGRDMPMEWHVGNAAGVDMPMTWDVDDS